MKQHSTSTKYSTAILSYQIKNMQLPDIRFGFETGSGYYSEKVKVEFKWGMSGGLVGDRD
jgi:hypothetical protein